MNPKRIWLNLFAAVVAAMFDGGMAEEAKAPVLAVPAAPAEPAMRVPEGCRAAPGTAVEPYTNTGWAKEIIHEKTGIEMVYIPAGKFVMGSPKSEANRRISEAQHRVTLTRGFYLGKYEVTQEQWQAIMGTNPSQCKQAGLNAPVEHVTWDDCQLFCAKLGKEFRMPTEAEWEYACRAGTTTAFHYGDKLDSLLANYNGNNSLLGEVGLYRGTTLPVGQFKPNAWGLYDMHGNVMEWCSDWFDDFTPRPVTDPTGPADPGMAKSHVSRGGGYAILSESCRSASRFLIPPKIQHQFGLGFRPVLTVP